MGKEDERRTVEEAWAKPLTLNDVLTKMSPERRAKIEARVDVRLKDEMTLQEIRKAFSLSQVSIAEKLGVSQESISRMENRNDVLISTLQDYLAAAGLELELTVKSAGRPSIKLKGLGDLKTETED